VGKEYRRDKRRLGVKRGSVGYVRDGPSGGERRGVGMGGVDGSKAGGGARWRGRGMAIGS